MLKRLMTMLVMITALSLSLQAGVQDSSQQGNVDLTTKTARISSNGLSKVKNFASKKINVATSKTDVATPKGKIASKKRDAAVRNKTMEAAAAQSKAASKAQDVIKRIARKPGIKRCNAPFKKGEVIDVDGVITKPADGVRKVYNRSGQALTFDPDGDSWLETEQSGQVDVVMCDNGDVYIKDIISNYRNGAWIKGTLSGNTISIPTGQLVNYVSEYDTPYAVYWGEKDGRDFFKNESRTTITFTIDGDNISLDNSNSDNVIGIFYEYGGNTFFSNFGDYESVYSYDHDYETLEVVEVTPPAGLLTETWYTRGHYYEGSSVAFSGQVEIGFDGNDVYLHGLFSDFPNAWMHGVINDGIAKFNGLQVLDSNGDETIYSVGYDGDNFTAFEMTFDAEAGLLTSVNELLANLGDENLNTHTWIEDLKISREDPFKPIEEFPYLNTFQTTDEQEAFIIIDANGDHDTWDFAMDGNEDWFARYTYNESFDADDWLISPAFRFEAGKQYRLSFETWNKGYDERLEVLAGSAATPAGMTIQLVEPTDITWEERQPMDVTITVAETGTYYIGFHAISNADMNKLFIDNVMVDVVELEAPVAPSNLTAVQTVDELEVTVNLTAPSEKRNGEPLGSNLAEVELLRDGEVVNTWEDVAPGVALTWVDNGVTIGVHKYQAVAYNEKGAGDKSEAVTVMVVTTLTVPYTADLTQRETFDIFTIIDANDDGSTWNWDDSYNTNYIYNSDNDGDDYLVTLPIELEAGKNYNVIVNAYNSGMTERMEVLLGKEATPQGLNVTLIEPTDVTVDEYEGEDYEAQFTVDEDGKYYIAIHAITDADAFRLMVKTITIDFGAEPTAPAAPAISVVPDELAELKATVTVTAPTTAINNSALTANLTKIEIMRDGILVGSVENVAPGANAIYIDEPDVVGEHTYQAVPFNASGKGLKSEKVKAYVGPDLPWGVENFTATDANNVVALAWDKVNSVGQNGGIVNPAKVDYLVWSTYNEPTWSGYTIEKDELLATLTDADSYNVDYDTNEGEQHIQYWIVETRNDATEYEGFAESAGVLVGTPYELPISENFVDNSLHYLWDTNGAIMISGQSSDGDGSSLALLSEMIGTIHFYSGKLNLADLTNPTLIMDVASNNINKLAVVGSIDGNDFTVISDNISVTSDFTQVKVPLASLQGGRYARVGVIADYQEASEIDPWEGEVVSLGDMMLIDNIHIAGMYQNDLAVEIAAPATVVAGNTASITVNVANNSENAASGFTVLVTAAGKELLNVSPRVTLESFKSWTQNVDFETSILDETGDVEIEAHVLYNDDQMTGNNDAQAIITIVAPSYPAPTDLVVDADNGFLLSWQAPDTHGTMSVTEDFEDTSVFSEFSLGGISATQHNGALGGWTLYDGNGLYCYSFNGFDVPNLGAPMAWMVFSTQLLSEQVANAYAPHSGDQLLLSTCVADGDPIPGTDHWLISPELMGNEQDISFFARVITSDYGAESFEVLYSTTGNDIDSFVSLDNVWTDGTDWTEFTFTVPEGTKYFAIRHISQDVFGLMIDDISYESGVIEPIGYNIYLDGVLVGTTTETVFDLSSIGLRRGHYIVAVTAVYPGDKESAPVKTDLDTTSGIDSIIIANQPVDIYTIDGRLVRSNATSLDGLKGLFLIGNKKVLVK